MARLKSIIFWVSLIGSFLFYSISGAIQGVISQKPQISLLNAMQKWARYLLKVNKITYEIENINYIDKKKKYIIAANHESIFDILLLAATIPIPFVFMVKKSLFKIPFFGLYMKKAGFISIDRKNIKKDYETLQKNKDNLYSILIFPEGTRNYDGNILTFKSGVTTLAKYTELDTIPISIIGTRHIMSKGNLTINETRLAIKLVL